MGRRIRSRGLGAAAALAASVGLLLSACGGGPTEPPPPPSPSIDLSPATVSLQRQLGAPPPQTTLTVRNTGGASLSWRAAADQTWVLLNPPSGTLAPGQSQPISLSVADLLFAAGSYAATVSVTGNASNSPATTAVALTVTQTDALALVEDVPVQGISGSAGSGLLLKFDVSSANTDLAGPGATAAARAAATLRFSLTGGSGNADLFVRLGSAPTTSSFDCQSTGATSNETCALGDPANGTWFALIRGVSDFSGVSLVAQIEIPRTLTVSGTLAGTGTVTSAPSGIDCTIVAGAAGGSCSAVFMENTSVTLSANTQAGSIFRGWAGDCAASGVGECTLTMSQDRAVTAQFDFVQQHTIQVLGASTGNGTITSNPAGVACTISAGMASGSCVAAFDENIPVTLTAAAQAGSFFEGWEGAQGFPPSCSGPGSCVLMLPQDNVTFAAFTLNLAETFAIEVRFNQGTAPTAGQSQAFTDAVTRWEGLISSGVPDVPLNITAGMCGMDSPALNETIDDLVVLVTLKPIDGPGGVLGQAGPCFIRNFSHLPLVGVMEFDTDDLVSLEVNGLLNTTILHEMGHVLGIGSLWRFFGLLADPARDGGIDPHFTGPQAIASFDNVGGTSFTGAKVPVESIGGPGTADAHWRESVFNNELMTGFINQGVNPLSEVSVSSLGDMGYLVDPSGADAYSLPLAALRARPARLWALGDDIFGGPLYVIDASGRILGRMRDVR
ncbi:MAG: leishmanolysin-related zinc metalloendopeptidase [Gemmatimonadota bacterium]